MKPKSAHFPDSFYRVAVKGLLVREGKLMLVEDSESLPVEWELPGGGLDFGESFQEGLTREVREEMNLPVLKIADRPLYMWTKKRHERRNMDWFYVLIMAFPIELEYEKFTPTNSCLSLRFFSKEEMLANKAGIADQLHPLIDIFNPADFEKI